MRAYFFNSGNQANSPSTNIIEKNDAHAHTHDKALAGHEKTQAEKISNEDILIAVNQKFISMVKALDAFQQDRLNFLKNQHEWDDKEVVYNHRFLKKEVSDMSEVVERMAKTIVKQNKTNWKLEQRVVDLSEEVVNLGYEIDQQASNFDKVLELLGEQYKITDPNQSI